MDYEALEAELLERAKAGDRVAFERALTPHLPTLLAYSRSICGDYHTAEDVVQETALIAFRNISHLFPEVEFASWLKGIARRQALSARRSSVRLPAVADQALENAYRDPRPEATSREREALRECLKRLADRAMKVVRNHYFEGLRLSDIASRLGLRLGTVKTIMFRARRQLERCVKGFLAVPLLDGD